MSKISYSFFLIIAFIHFEKKIFFKVDVSSFAGKHTNLVQIKTQNVHKEYRHSLFVL